jgi:hypothetical protein
MTNQGPETKHQHWLRRGRELNKMRKAELCALYRRMGHIWSANPLETWRKDEVISGIVDLEWTVLPDDRKAPTPEPVEPACAKGCGLAVGEHTKATGHWFTYPTSV